MKKRTQKLIGLLAVTIIGGIVVAKAGATWRLLTSIAATVFHWLGTSISLPVWLAILLGLIGLIAVLACIVTYWVARSTPIPSYRDYQQDTFFDVVWRWSYTSEGTPAYDLWCYCRKMRHDACI